MWLFWFNFPWTLFSPDRSKDQNWQIEIKTCSTIFAWVDPNCVLYAGGGLKYWNPGHELFNFIF